MSNVPPLIEWRQGGQGWNGQYPRPAWIGNVMGLSSGNPHVTLRRTFSHKSVRKTGNKGDREITYTNTVMMIVHPKEEFAVIKVKHDRHFSIDEPRFMATHAELLEMAAVEAEAREYMRAIFVADDFIEEE